MADYLDDFRRRGGKSVEGIESVVKRNILPEFGKLAVTKLTPQRLRDWHRGLAERTRYWRSRKGAAANLAPFDCKDAEDVRRRRASTNRVLTYLKAALNLAWRNGLVPSDDAWRRVKLFRSVEAPLVRYLGNDEMTRLRNATKGNFGDLVYLALLTGCRYGELCRFKFADYNPDVGTLSVRISKGGKLRHVTLTDEASAFVDLLVAGRTPEDPLLRRDDGQVWKRAEQVRPMRVACALAGIAPAVGFHVLRHTHGSLLAMRAVPMAVIARQLGHADTRMEALCASSAELCGGHDQGGFSTADAGRTSSRTVQSAPQERQSKSLLSWGSLVRIQPEVANKINDLGHLLAAFLCRVLLQAFPLRFKGLQ